MHVKVETLQPGQVIRPKGWTRCVTVKSAVYPHPDHGQSWYMDVHDGTLAVHFDDRVWINDTQEH